MGDGALHGVDCASRGVDVTEGESDVAVRGGDGALCVGDCARGGVEAGGFVGAFAAWVVVVTKRVVVIAASAVDDGV